MTTLSKKTISATRAGELITTALGKDGTYRLVDNRRGKAENIIPYHKIGRKVFYILDDIERFIISNKPSVKPTSESLKKIELSTDRWLMGPDISDEGFPIVTVTKGAGTEVLTPDDARDIGRELTELADIAETLLH